MHAEAPMEEIHSQDERADDAKADRQCDAEVFTDVNTFTGVNT
jgi:hypothetical protein